MAIKESRLVWKALIKKAGLQTLRAQCALDRMASPHYHYFSAAIIVFWKNFFLLLTWLISLTQAAFSCNVGAAK